MNLGGIFDRAVDILRARFQLFAGLGLVTGLVQLAFQLASVHPASVAGESAGHIALRVGSYCATFVLWVASIVASAIVTAATCLAASRVHLGEDVTLREALGTYRSKVGRLVGLGILMGLYAGWPLFITAIVAVIVSIAIKSTYALIVVFILGSIPTLALYARCALAYPVVAVENLTASGSFSRGIKLGEGGRWRVCWGLVFPLAIVLVFSGGSTGLIEHFKNSVHILAENPIAVAGLEGIVSLLLALVFTPLSGIVLTVLYYDQRMRLEGYDIERMMDAAGMTTPAGSLAEASLAAIVGEGEQD